MFEAAEIRAMLAAASGLLKAMILLGINCGFGNTDVANLRFKHLDLKGGWCNYPRPKTGIPRRCPLWPETVTAIRAVLKVRPEPQDRADADLVFLTTTGQRWVWSQGNIADIDAANIESLAHVSRVDRVTDAMAQLKSASSGLSATATRSIPSDIRSRQSAANRATKWQSTPAWDTPATTWPACTGSVLAMIVFESLSSMCERG